MALTFAAGDNSARLPSCRDENDDDKVVFKGWERMAIPLKAFNVVEVHKPNVGQNKPASVTADILIDTKREYNTCCLACSFCALSPPIFTNTAGNLLYSEHANQAYVSAGGHAVVGPAVDKRKKLKKA